MICTSDYQYARTSSMIREQKQKAKMLWNVRNSQNVHKEYDDIDKLGLRTHPPPEKWTPLIVGYRTNQEGILPSGGYDRCPFPRAFEGSRSGSFRSSVARAGALVILLPSYYYDLASGGARIIVFRVLSLFCMRFKQRTTYSYDTYE